MGLLDASNGPGMDGDDKDVKCGESRVEQTTTTLKESTLNNGRASHETCGESRRRRGLSQIEEVGEDEEEEQLAQPEHPVVDAGTKGEDVELMPPVTCAATKEDDVDSSIVGAARGKGEEQHSKSTTPAVDAVSKDEDVKLMLPVTGAAPRQEDVDTLPFRTAHEEEKQQVEPIHPVIDKMSKGEETAEPFLVLTAPGKVEKKEKETDAEKKMATKKRDMEEEGSERRKAFKVLGLRVS